MTFSMDKWDNERYVDLLNYIESLEDSKYRDFHKKLVPGLEKFIGVRAPELRKISKEISKGNWREYLDIAKDGTYEEIILQGMVIGNVKCEVEEFILQIEKFIPKINNWAVCDSFCSGLKKTKKYKKEIFKLIKKHIYSSNPWAIRFSIVMLLAYYVEENYINDIFKYCDSINNDEYYVQMAIAWLISMCFIKYEEETLTYLENNNLDNFTYNKALQKIIESTRVDKEKKNIIRSKKRK